MKREYKTEEEAHEALETFINKTWFCPLIVDACRPDCACFGNAWIRKNQIYQPAGATWIVENNYCNNHMFHGD